MTEVIRYIDGLTDDDVVSTVDKPIVIWYHAESETGVQVRGMSLDSVCRYAVKNFHNIINVGRVG